VNRRKFLQFLGAGAVVTAAGLMVPDVARKFFLPPRAGWTLGAEPGLNVGDVITFEGVHDPLVIRRCKQFVVTSIDDRGAYIDPHEMVRYDAAWTLPNGEQKQLHLDFEAYASNPTVEAHDDKMARDILERIMRREGGTPGSTRFKLELPRNISDARYI
jgi:hypothetical protein